MLANNNMYQMLASTQKSRNEWVDVLNKAVTEVFQKYIWFFKHYIAYTHVI